VSDGAGIANSPGDAGRPESSRFCRLAVSSKLVTEEQVTGCLSGLSETKRGDDQVIAKQFIRDRVLTLWQARRILRGRTEGFFFGRYKLLDKLGRGGMGTVYRAEHTLMKNAVALKLVSPERLQDKDLLKRFLREIRVAAQLQHPNVVTTHYADVEGRTVYLAMELIDGVDLAQYVDKHGALAFQKAADIVRQAASGLHYAHTLSSAVVHRDIKPTNIMLTVEGQAKILDLGLARAMGEVHRDSVQSFTTQSGTILGTPQYMAPEQVRSSRSVDGRSDIYSLGCTFYFLLASEHAITGESLLEILDRHRAGDYPAIETLRENVPSELAAIVRRMMAKDAADRFQSCAEVVDALADWTNKDRSQGFAETLCGAPTGEKPIATAEPSESKKTLMLDSQRGVQLEFVRVDGGPYVAGCSKEMADRIIDGLALSDPDDAKRWLVSSEFRDGTLPEYWISRVPVTNEQFKCFVDTTGHPASAAWPGGTFAPADARKPVVGVGLADARSFCAWAKVRLPTADEWEKAARGSDGRAYPWGNEFDAARCNCDEGGAEEIVNVDEYPAGDSPYGLRQMAGNVWEWVESTDGKPQIRGGSVQSSCRVYGASFTPMGAASDLQDTDLGFRVILAEPPNPGATVRRSREEVRKAIEAEMAVVPRGPFVKGLNPSQVDELAGRYHLEAESKQKLLGDGAQTVVLPEFNISRFCVTNEQYLTFVQTTRKEPPPDWDPGLLQGTVAPRGDWLRLPVSGVTHQDAMDFSEWVGWRLPTGDEWEKAARGTDGRLYPWGSQFNPQFCNSAESDRQMRVAVDALPEGASPYDLFNCTGNVLEWVADRKGEMAGIRGGSYQVSGAIYGLCGYAIWAQRSMKELHFGFRVAK